MNLEWLKSSFKLLESALRERNKQLEIQKKEIEFLRNELRRKDDVIKEYENLINEREDMERQEVEILHKEIRTLRMDAMSKVVTIREHESEIERLESKVEKLMSVMPPTSLPRARAQGVSAEPAAKNLNVNFQQFLKHYTKSQRWVRDVTSSLYICLSLNFICVFQGEMLAVFAISQKTAWDYKILDFPCSVDWHPINAGYSL